MSAESDKVVLVTGGTRGIGFGAAGVNAGVAIRNRAGQSIAIVELPSIIAEQTKRAKARFSADGEQR
jgi:NAD(P)-dependent dehydrogenase (short-subunit alcohol dehydrogenase family)